MSNVNIDDFSNVFDEHIRSISKKVIEEELANQTGKRSLGPIPRP